MELNLHRRMGDDKSDRQNATNLAAHGSEGEHLPKTFSMVFLENSNDPLQSEHRLCGDLAAQF